MSNRETKKTPAKARLNFYVDLVTAIVFSAMVGTGISLRWYLPPGSRGGEGLVWFGQGRHFYGDIHFWVAVSMLVLIIIHVWLHWSWVTSLWARLVGSLRNPLTWVLILLMFLLIFSPLIFKPIYSEDYKLEHERMEEEWYIEKGR